ncbi:putative ABC transporter permease YclI [Longispora fulva]|uniref:Putative ABC transport system permease protein n=1 Tax=Longispora fulva TaxID=619741 RepID=A0A8J7GNZ4_9ACTN|nr:ABC transporter permease [Longispora fulva]MBG6135178.1 putative ABC transport system permease protein [Longispora fulva]GIG56587.1 putative ABC transporter permease YclI [Longispora fulva]
MNVNFVKRAGLSLVARKAKSLIMLGLFLVIFTLVLAGFLLQSATRQSAANTKAKVGADISLYFDFEKAMAKANGGMPQISGKDSLSTAKVDALGKSPLVRGYNYSLESSSAPPEGVKLVEGGGKPPEGLHMATAAGGDSAGPVDMNTLSLSGARDLGLTDEFGKGRHTLVEGRAPTMKDDGSNVALVEERLAKKNTLKVGGKLTLRSADGKHSAEFEIIGVYRDPTALTDSWMPPSMLPGNKVYVPFGALATLNPATLVDGQPQVQTAKYTLKDPERFAQFQQAAKAAGIDLEVFKLDNNDRLYNDLVGPIQGIASFAGVAVWLVSIAGAAILGLIVTLAIRDRRQELGILLSLGERKWKLVGQHLVEVVAVAVLALGFSVLVGQALSQYAGSALLDREVAAAKKANQNGMAGGAVTVGGTTGAVSAVRIGSPVESESMKPVDRISVRLEAAEVGRVAGVGLGIALLATVLPGLAVLKLNPRTILMKGE